ncbi:MAG: hypothetical protein V1792_17355 [Pseudomonadota bacterium]
MKGINGIRKVALLALSVALVLTGSAPTNVFSIDESRIQSFPRPAEEEPDGQAKQEFPVPFKPLPKTITPCRACHGPEKDFPVNFQRRESLLVHRNIQLNHGGVRVWCLDCHHPDKRNYLLPLSDGKLITFEHSYLLCGKCHGTKFRDWRNGIHGKRTGSWNGRKQYLLCTNCHDPHQPKFKPISPMPPPEKPRTPKEYASGSVKH